MTRFCLQLLFRDAVFVKREPCPTRYEPEQATCFQAEMSLGVLANAKLSQFSSYADDPVSQATERQTGIPTNPWR